MDDKDPSKVEPQQQVNPQPTYDLDPRPKQISSPSKIDSPPTGQNNVDTEERDNKLNQYFMNKLANLVEEVDSEKKQESPSLTSNKPIEESLSPNNMGGNNQITSAQQISNELVPNHETQNISQNMNPPLNQSPTIDPYNMNQGLLANNQNPVPNNYNYDSSQTYNSNYQDPYNSGFNNNNQGYGSSQGYSANNYSNNTYGSNNAYYGGYGTYGYQYGNPLSSQPKKSKACNIF